MTGTGRCGHCRRPIGHEVYCPLADASVVDCMFGVNDKPQFVTDKEIAESPALWRLVRRYVECFARDELRQGFSYSPGELEVLRKLRG